MSSKALIIPAAGSGRRMKKETHKPYLKLGGTTILERTIRQFLPLEGLEQVVVATSNEYVAQAERILKEILPAAVDGYSLPGGKERQYSIYKALQKISDVDLVVVHDAVRPFVDARHINQCCDVALEIGAAVLGVPAKDTIKRVDGRGYVKETPPRHLVWQTQTPQVFQKSIILEAYEQAKKDDFMGTDDSSLVERLGVEVKMVKGDQSNFKITYPLDLKLAKLLINDH